MFKLIIITTHPIQYYAPIFKQLSQNKKIEPLVFYTWGENCLKNKFDPGFGKKIEWDIPLLDGYQYKFLKNISKKPSSSHFSGIINPDIIQEIKQHQPDALLVISWSYKSHLQVLRHFKGRIPIYFRGDSNLLDEKKGMKVIARRIFLRWVFSHVDKALYVGQNNKDYYLKHGLKESQLKWVPHAIDNKRFSENFDIKNKEAVDWKEKLKIPKESKVVLFVGKFERKKNPLLLIEAAKKINQSNVYFLSVGNGDLEEEMKSKSANNSNILFLPFQNQSKMPVVYRLGDVYVLPSQGPGETWGLAVNEAMACGKPVLISDRVGCGKDLVKEGENGYIFKSNDLIDFNEKLIRILDSDYRQMGKYSREIIERWSIQEAVNKIESTLL